MSCQTLDIEMWGSGETFTDGRIKEKENGPTGKYCVKQGEGI